MALPLWDDIDLPPDFTLVDINGLEPELLRTKMQAAALDLWIEQAPSSFEDPLDREWDDNEAMFVVKDGAGDIVAIQLIVEVE